MMMGKYYIRTGVGPYVYVAFVPYVAILHSPGISWGGGNICTITADGPEWSVHHVC